MGLGLPLDLVEPILVGVLRRPQQRFTACPLEMQAFDRGYRLSIRRKQAEVDRQGLPARFFGWAYVGMTP